MISVSLSPAVLLILQLVEAARPDLPRDEVFSRAIGVYAQRVGIPALSRDISDFSAVPDFERAGVNRFRTAADHAGVPP